MENIYRKKIGIPKENEFILTNSEWKQKHGQDTDSYWYDEIDRKGKIINRYIISDSTSMHPPFGRSITWDKK